MTYATVDQIKIALAALLALFLFLMVRRRGGAGRSPATGRRRSLRRIALATLAILSLANFHHFGFFHHRFLDYGWLDSRAYVHLWDLYHYYLGAKYFDELGYGGLYTATLAADAEDAGHLSGMTRVRNLDGDGFLTREQALRRGFAVKAAFSPPRWRQFTSDLGYFTGRLPPGVMAQLLVDHGYNPTPAWNTTGSFLANRVPVERLATLAMLDVALLLAAGAAIGVAFGAETALAAAAFFGINAYASFAFTGGSFLRYDWLLGLVFSLCLLRRGRYAGAGVFLAFAAAVRVFPALFLFGLAVKAAAGTARARVLPPRYARLLLSFLAASLLLFGYGCLNGRGVDAWRQFAGKIAVHHSSITGNSVGFKMVFLYDESWEDPINFGVRYTSTGEEAETALNRVKGAEADSRRPLFLLYALAVLALAALPVLGLPDEGALAWGFVPVFMLLNLSNYYYAFLVLAAAVFYRTAARRAAPLLLLLLAQPLVLWIGLTVDYSLRATALSSLVFFLFTLALIFVELTGNRRRIARRITELTG